MSTEIRTAQKRVTRAWQRLASVGARRTFARQRVIEVLADARGHLPVAEVHELVVAVRPEVNLSTVHRTVAFLVEHGVAHLLPWPGEARYGLNDRPHYHAVCDRCGVVSEIAASTLSDAVAAAEQSSYFQLGESGLALFGRCPDCR